MSCNFRYVNEVIHGAKQTQGDAGRRGNAIHKFLQTYVRDLVNCKRAKLPELFDSLMRGMEPGAREIVEPLRDTFEIDPESVFATEQKIAMTEAFVITPPGLPGAAYEGTLDLVLLRDETLAEIIDFKSQFHAVDADTFQGRLYSLMLMMLNPQIQQVEFS